MFPFVGAKTFLPFSLRVYWFEPLNPQVSLTLLSPLNSLYQDFKLPGKYNKSAGNQTGRGFFSIFLVFSYESSRGHIDRSREKSPAPTLDSRWVFQ